MHTAHNYEAIRPTTENFRDLPLEEAFTWGDGLTNTGEAGLYTVAFRSIRNKIVSPRKITRLLELDAAAFEDAKQADGFGTYCFDDELSADGKALSFCTWESKRAAKAAAERPLHQAAVAYIRGEGRDVYSFYSIETQYMHATLGSVVLSDVQVVTWGEAA